MSKTYNRRKNIKEKQSREKIIIKNKIEYLESFKKEYDNERIKKQSLETRAGIIITMLGGLFIFLINDLELFKYLFIFFKNPSCLINYLKFLLILAIIIYFILIFYQLINILNIQNYGGFDVKPPIEYNLEYNDTLDDLLLTYKEIIIVHRENNSKNAIFLSKAIEYLVYLFIFLLIFLILKGGD